VRILICGSRTWTDKKAILDKLLSVEASYDSYIKTVIHGGARGADTLAGIATKEMCGYKADANHTQAQVDDNTPAVLVFPANWNKYGRAAGAIRNQQMLTEGRPDLVLAFWDQKSRGTKHMIELAKRAGVPVEVITK